MSLHPAKFWYVCDGERIDFSLYGGFIIDWPNGVDGLMANVTNVPGIDGIGTELQSVKLPERIISINGYLIGPNSSEDRRRLQRMFSPMKQGRLYGESLDFQVYYLDCYASTAAKIEGKRKNPRFYLQLTAGYPYWQSQREYKLKVSRIGTAAVCSDLPAVYRMEISCTGDCKNIAFSHANGNEVRYAGALSAGDILSIQVSPFGKVLARIGNRDVIGLVRAELKKLPPGQWNYRLTAEESSGEITAEITYREARDGI